MDEDEINIIAYNYVGYIKLKKDIIFPADDNRPLAKVKTTSI